MVDKLYANVDVGAALEQQLPEDQKGLSGLIASGLREFSDRAAQRLLESPRAQEAWVDTIAFSHQQLLNVLEDDVRGTTTENGAVFLDLRPLIIQLGERVPLVARIAQQLPNDSGRIKIIEADQLETAQDLTQLMKALGCGSGSSRSCSGHSRSGSRAGAGARFSEWSRGRRSSPGCSCSWSATSPAATSSTRSPRPRP